LSFRAGGEESRTRLLAALGVTTIFGYSKFGAKRAEERREPGSKNSVLRLRLCRDSSLPLEEGP
jgi:hypothetical protein